MNNHTIERSISRNSQKSFLISYNAILIILATALVCFGTIRNGNDRFTINIWIILFLADVISIIVVFTTKRINITSFNLILVAVSFLVTFAQKVLATGYYSFGSAFSGVLLFAFLVLSVGVVVQARYEIYIFKTINAFNMVGVACIIIQMLFKWLGVRLDQMGILSEFLFNAWDFYDVFRPCGIFSEPSHFAEMALISVFYYLFIEKKNVRLVFIAIALVLSTSSLGIIGFAFLVALRFLELEKFKQLSFGVKIGFIMVWVGIIFFIMYCFYWGGSDNWLLNRILSGSSFSVRVKRSYELFQRMDWSEKIIGIGVQNQERYLNYHHIILPSDTYETTYANREFAQTFGYIFCTMGLLGFAAFVMPLISAFVKKNKKVKCFIVLFLYICNFCCIFSRSIFFVYFIALYSLLGMEGVSHETK